MLPKVGNLPLDVLLFTAAVCGLGAFLLCLVRYGSA